MISFNHQKYKTLNNPLYVNLIKFLFMILKANYIIKYSVKIFTKRMQDFLFMKFVITRSL